MGVELLEVILILGGRGPKEIEICIQNKILAVCINLALKTVTHKAKF